MPGCRVAGLPGTHGTNGSEAEERENDWPGLAWPSLDWTRGSCTARRVEALLSPSRALRLATRDLRDMQRPTTPMRTIKRFDAHHPSTHARPAPSARRRASTPRTHRRPAIVLRRATRSEREIKDAECLLESDVASEGARATPPFFESSRSPSYSSVSPSYTGLQSTTLASQLRLCCHFSWISSAAQDESNIMELHDTVLSNCPQSEKTLSVLAKMRVRGVMKESYRDHLHLLITTAGMSAVLGLVHTIITSGKKLATLIGTRIWNISASIVPQYPEISSK